MKRPYTLEISWGISHARNSDGYTTCTLRVDRKKRAGCNGGGYDMRGTVIGSFIASEFSKQLRQLKPSDMPQQSHWEPERARLCDADCRKKYIDDLHKMVIDGKKGKPQELPRLPEDCFECPTCKGQTIQSREGKRVNDGRSFYGLTFHDPNYNPEESKLDRADGTFTKPEDVGKTFKQLRAEGKVVDLEVYRTFYRASSKHATKRHTVPMIDGACGLSTVEKIINALGYELAHVVDRKGLDVFQLTPSRKAKRRNAA